MSNFKRLPLAVAVAMAMGVGFSYAEEGQAVPYGKRSDIDIDKTVDVDYNLSYYGQIYTLGLVLVDSSAAAFSEVNQKTHDNKLSDLVIDDNGAVLSTPGSLNDDNNATLSGNVLSDATGNAGVNVAAGSNNVQQNSVAIAEGDSLNSRQTIEIDFSASDDQVNNHSGSWTWSQHAAATADASHTKTETDTLTSSSEAHLDVDLDVSDKIAVETPDGNYSVSSVVGGAALGEFEADIGGDVMSSMGGEQGDLNAVSAEGGFVAGGLLGIEDGTIDYGVAGRDSETWTGTESSSESAHLEASDDYSEEASWETVNEQHYAFSASFDIELLFGGAAEAETFSDQYSYRNENPSSGTNDAWMGDSVGSGFSGNIGVNVVAGNNNAQANQLALAENSGVMALATASSNQAVHDNLSVGQGSTEASEMEVALTGTASGTYEGIADQRGDVYLDTWEEQTHPGGSNTGHVDVDDQVQGAQDDLGDGGAFVFTELGTIELDEIELTANLPVVSVDPNSVVNNATLTGDAFSEASGNIAINVAAGNGNLQGNALAIASIGTPVVAPPPGGGGE
jgi:heat shock protein HslJ